ncbi:MAG: choice-of-anchor D domain-containing protein, partial [Saprospiraceae bacterium]
MKNSLYSIHSLLFVSLLFLLPLSTNAQGTVCNSGSTTVLNTQDAVDDFVDNYGTCDQLNNLTLSGSDITNVDGLSNIRIVGNSLRIQNLPNLENLNGLASLTRVSNLVIENCPKITDLDAFSNLTRINIEVRIQANANLTSVAGLQNVTSGNPATTAPIRFVRIFNNAKLADCCVLYDFISHPNVQLVAVYGNASTCNQNSITADPNAATINVVQNDEIIENGVICANTATQLRVNAGFTYQWAADPSLSATDIANPTITPTENTTYSVTITGCNEQVATKTIAVTVRNDDRVYVKSDATGNNDGTSWENAFTELQPALNLPCADTEIWVAAGTYLPTEIPYDEHDDNERLKTFALSKDVTIYGGFAGTETTLEERNFAINETILDGNGGYHTLIATALTRATIIDGFTIQGGSASGGAPTSTYAGADFTTFRGGGMLLNAASPTITNCIFKYNLASLGSAFTARFNSQPLLTNCLIANNTAAAGSSAPSVVEIQTNSKPRFINCTITNNDNGIAHRSGTVTAYINTIFYANNTNFTFFGDGDANIRNSLIEGSGGSNNWNLIEANDLGGNIDADPKFVDSDNGDYSLRNDSPAFNFGNNADNETPTDLAGNARIFSDVNGSIIDLGAYELQELGFPEIAVEGNGTDIMHQDMAPSATDNTDFRENRIKAFTIKNVGTNVLTLGTDAVSVTGTAATDFIVTKQPNATVPINGSTTFTIRFDPAEIGLKNAVVNINSNDADEQPFTYSIQGTGTRANTEEVTIDGPFCNGCDDPQEGSALGCLSGVTQIIQAIDVSDLTADFFISSVNFNQESFDDAPNVTVNIFCGDENTVLYTPANTPIYSQVYKTRSEDDGKCVNIPFDTPPLIDADCGNRIWVEFRTTGGNSCVSTPPNCNGTAATGRLTYIRAPQCGINTPRTVRSEGFRLDATFAINVFIPLQIEGELAYCSADNTTTLSAGADWQSYLWSNDATTSTVEVAAGTHSVTVTDVNGATYADEVTVVENASPQPIITGDLETCNSTTLDAGTWSSYLWSNDATTQTIEIGLGTHMVTVTAENGCTGTDEVTVADTQAPTATCKNINVQLDANGQATITADEVDNGSSDNCGNVALSIDKTTFTCADVGENNVTLTVNDGNGNTKTCTAI